MTKKINSSIVLHRLEWKVNLGWSQEERAQPQTVFVDIKLLFKEPPKACTTDDLADTYCYDKLVQTIKTHIQSHEFRLIEHVGQTIYQICKKSLSDDISLSIKITKKPAIIDLTDGVSFFYGDEDCTWSF